MKKLILCFLLLLAVAAKGQDFEGTIKWSMKVDLDPAAQAKIGEEQQKKMNDPATQAKVKELQAKMNDPQMKAMMDANPQMRQMMERNLKMMSGDVSSMMPKGLTIKLKGGNAVTTMEGGPMAVEVLYMKTKDQAFRLDRQNKSFTALPKGGTTPQQSGGTPPKVTKTAETTKILGYNCTKYLVETTEGGRTMNQTIWATTEIKDIDLKSLAKQKMNRGQSIIYEGIEGVPLRVQSAVTEGNFTMEVTEIKKESLSPADFTIPADFKETEGKY